MKRLIAILIMMTVCLGVEADDKLIDFFIQQDVITGRLSEGQTKEQICDALTRYFSVQCVAFDDRFVLTIGYGVNITYLATFYVKK